MPDLVIRASGLDRVIRSEGRSLVIRPTGRTLVIRDGRGAPGPAGVSAETLTRLAAGPLSGQRVVRDLGDGSCAYPNMATAADGEFVLGITTGAADDGAAVTIQIGGEMSDGAWTWTPGPVFAAAGGQLTQAPGGTAFIRQVGLAVSATKIVIGLQPPIVTA